MRIGSVGVGRAVVAASIDAGRRPVSAPSSAGGRSFAEHLRLTRPSSAAAPQAATRPIPSASASKGNGGGAAPTLEERVAEVAGRLHIRTGDLMAVMRFESGLRPDAMNPTSHAVGLIQFLPRTAADLLGLPLGQHGRERQAVETLAAMSADEQLDLVEAYLEKVLGGRPANLRDTYMAVLYPAAVGRGDGYVIAHADGESAFERAVYRQNAPLDANGDGAITAGEAAARVAGVRG